MEFNKAIKKPLIIALIRRYPANEIGLKELTANKISIMWTAKTILKKDDTLVVQGNESTFEALEDYLRQQ